MYQLMCFTGSAYMASYLDPYIAEDIWAEMLICFESHGYAVKYMTVDIIDQIGTANVECIVFGPVQGFIECFTKMNDRCSALMADRLSEYWDAENISVFDINDFDFQRGVHLEKVHREMALLA